MSDSDLLEADLFVRASAWLRQASREEKLELLRLAGALAEQPRLGDKVVARNRFGDPLFGVVVGVSREGHRWQVVRGEGEEVELVPMEVFADGGAVELIERAPDGAEQAAVLGALEQLGTRFDLRHLQPPTDGDDAATLSRLADRVGLLVTPDALALDTDWDEDSGRYRDRRGRRVV